MNEAELLFSELLNCERMSLLEKRFFPLDKKISQEASRVLKRRMLGEPLQHILKKCDFMGLQFTVNEDVFIPRPETEILVEAAVKKISVEQSRRDFIRILDIGTGSGCIAVSLAKFLPQARITAADISAQAIETARKNAAQNGVDAKISFVHEDFFCMIPQAFDCIVSNPPYVAFPEIETLQAEVQREPVAALDGGTDGLDFYRRLSGVAHLFLRTGALLIMEIGCNQRVSVEKMLNDSSHFELCEVINDYNGIERILIARKIRPWINLS